MSRAGVVAAHAEYLTVTSAQCFLHQRVITQAVDMLLEVRVHTFAAANWLRQSAQQRRDHAPCGAVCPVVLRQRAFHTAGGTWGELQHPGRRASDSGAPACSCGTQKADVGDG